MTTLQAPLEVLLERRGWLPVADVVEVLLDMEPGSEAEASFIRELEAEGWTPRELAAVLNVSRTWGE